MSALTPRRMSEARDHVHNELQQLLPKGPGKAFYNCQWKLDEYAGKCMNNCGGSSLCEYIVPAQQFENYPQSTLLVARIFRLVLTFFVVISVIALITGWLFEGKLSFVEEIDQAPWLAAPKMVICPQPWGGSFSEPLLVKDTNLVEVPGGKKELQEVEWMEHDCEAISDRLKRCACLDFSENELAPHGKRGQLEYIDYIKLSFTAKNAAEGNDQFAFAFYEEGMPQQWSYGTLGHAVEGDIRSEEVAAGKTEFTEGTSTARYGFRVTGDGPSTDDMTHLVFGYDKFLVYVMASFEGKFSVFAIMTIIITLCAAINNFGLFDIAFPETAETSELEPTICLSACCPCCMCWSTKDGTNPLSPKKGDGQDPWADAGVTVITTSTEDQGKP